MEEHPHRFNVFVLQLSTTAIAGAMVFQTRKESNYVYYSGYVCHSLMFGPGGVYDGWRNPLKRGFSIWVDCAAMLAGCARDEAVLATGLASSDSWGKQG